MLDIVAGLNFIANRKLRHTGEIAAVSRSINLESAMILRRLSKSVWAVVALVMTTQSALAMTECEKQLYQIYNGDGLILLSFQGGGSGYVFGNNPSFSTITAAAMTALAASRIVVVRYAADNVSCAAYDRTDVVGLWLR